jgi:hypothetical protein
MPVRLDDLVRLFVTQQLDSLCLLAGRNAPVKLAISEVETYGSSMGSVAV